MRNANNESFSVQTKYQFRAPNPPVTSAWQRKISEYQNVKVSPLKHCTGLQSQVGGRQRFGGRDLL